MITRSDYRKSLYDKAKSLGYEGYVVELIISMLSDNYYDTYVESLRLLQESNIDTAVNINSLIELSSSRMFSVFKGINSRIVLRLQPTEYKVYRRGDVIHEVDDFKLFVYKDTEILPDTNVELDLMISKEFYNTSKKISGKYYKEFTVSDLSEDYMLLDNDTEVVTTDNFEQHLKDSTTFPITITDFGLRYYGNLDLTLSGFSYYDFNSNIDTSLIDLGGNRILSHRIIKGVQRSDIEDIKYKFHSYINTIGKIRSNTDIVEIFENFYNHSILKADYYIKSAGNTRSSKFYYIPRTDGTQLNKSAFIQKYRDNVLGDIIIEEGTRIQVNITMDCENKDIESINRVFNMYFGFRKSLNKDKLIADLYKNTKITLIKSIRLMKDNSEITEYVCQEGEYLKLVLNG